MAEKEIKRMLVKAFGESVNIGSSYDENRRVEFSVIK